MAAYTASVTGNWSSTATWGDSGPPGTGDTATINKGITVTVDSNVSVGTTIVGANSGGGSGLAVLVLGAYTLTMEGNLTIGNGATADGQLTFGAGSTLALGSNNLLLNNCKLASTASSGSWAKITGSGAISTGTAYTAPKQEVNLSYVSFQNTGAITIALGGTSGAVTNGFAFTHNAIIGSGAVTFGLGGYTPLATTIDIQNNDLRDITGDWLITGLNGTGSGTKNIINNTWLQSSTTRQFRINSFDGFTITGNIFKNINWGKDNIWSSGGHQIESNLMAITASLSGGTGHIIVNEGEAASSIENNYVYITYANPRWIGFSGTGGSGTHEITGNIIEDIYNTDGGNYITQPTLGTNLTRNILIGSGCLVTYTAAKTAVGTITVSRNTVLITDNSADQYGHIFVAETNGLLTGTINIGSNSLSYQSGVSPAASAYFAVDLVAASEQTLANAGLNNAEGLNSSKMYNDIAVTSSYGDDIFEDPDFEDKSRNLATWDDSEGSGTGTADAAITYLLLKNGYNSTTKTQSDTPSAKTVTDLATWVKAGFVPHNVNFDGAGVGGVDIGAMDYEAAGGSSIVPVLLRQYMARRV